LTICPNVNTIKTHIVYIYYLKCAFKETELKIDQAIQRMIPLYSFYTFRNGHHICLSIGYVLLYQPLDIA